MNINHISNVWNYASSISLPKMGLENITSLFKRCIETLNPNSMKLDTDTFFWQKYILTAGVAISCLGAIYCSIVNQVVIRQICILAGSIAASAVCYQHFLERLITKMHGVGQELQYKLHCAEVGLEDRRLVLEELRLSRKKQEELSGLIAELSTAVTFFTQLKGLLEKGSIEQMSDLFREGIRKQIESVEKVLEVVHIYFARNQKEIAVGLLEVKNLLQSLHQRDLDTVAILIKMDQKVSYLCTEVGSIKNSLEQIQDKVEKG